MAWNHALPRIAHSYRPGVARKKALVNLLSNTVRAIDPMRNTFSPYSRSAEPGEMFVAHIRSRRYVVP